MRRMSRRKLWLAVGGTFVTLGVALVAACGVDAIGDELTGTGNSGDAADERPPSSLPDSGPVPVGDGATFDVDATPADPCSVCADAGGTCRFADGGADAGDGGDTCAITCAGNGGCPNVVCPSGLACEVVCKDEATCKALDCTKATRCDVRCEGKLACENVTCAGSACSLRCEGEGACGGDGGRAFCRATQECDVLCKGKGSCSLLVCQSGTCKIDCEGDDACRSARARGATDASCATKACDEFDCSGSSCNLACADSPEACDRVCCDAGTCTGAAADAGASPTKCVTK